MSRINRALIAVSLLGLLAACNASFFSPSSIQGVDIARSSPTPKPSPSVSPTPTPSPTPVDPCRPVVGVNLSGPTEVQIGSTFKLDVTPVSPSGPLEGSLDFCQAGRFVTIESLSANLRCVGSCSGFGPQFLAQGVGAFSITVRVEGASATFAGTIR